MISLFIKNWFQFVLCALITTILVFCVLFILSIISLLNLHTIRDEVTVVGRHVVQDWTRIFTTNVVSLIGEGLYENLANVSKRFCSSMPFTRYIIYLDDKGEIYWNIPCTKSRDFFFLEPRTSFFVEYFQAARSIQIERLSEVKNIVLDLYSDDRNIGSLILGSYPILNILDLLQFELYYAIIIFVLICFLVKLLNVLKTLT